MKNLKNIFLVTLVVWIIGNIFTCSSGSGDILDSVKGLDTNTSSSSGGGIGTLSPPTGLTATAGDAEVILTWTVDPTASGYNVYRSTTAGVTITTAQSISCYGSPCTDNGLANGTTYYYIVTSLDNSYNESAPSAEVSATPQPAPQPDLQLVSFTLPATTMLHENTYNISVTITNAGNAAINSAFYVGATVRDTISTIQNWAKTTTTSTTNGYGATQIASLAAGASTTITVPITIPTYQTLGINYIGVYLDSGSSVTETNETNNYGTDVGSFIQQVTIAEYRPDFTLVSFSPPATMTRGQLYNVSVTLTNSGNKDNNIAFYVGAAVRDTISTIQNWAKTTTTSTTNGYGATQIASLAAGASTTITVPITIPTYQTLGINYIGVYLDSGSHVTEYSNGGETNNYGTTVGTHIVQVNVN